MTFEQFISRFPKQRPHARGIMVQCPAHDDSPNSPSLSVARGDKGILVNCFAGCNPPAIVAAMGLRMTDLFDDGGKPQAAKPVASPLPKLAPPPKNEPEVKSVIETIYPYHDQNGNEVYQAIRLKPKSFRQRRMVNGQWVWNMEGVQRYLYRLPQVMEAQTVIICEGEKDADNLVKLGYCATCNVGGAKKWLDGYSESLRDKEVIICGDNDEVGREHVELVFNSIAGYAKTVRILKLPDSVKDASDFIATFKDAAEAKNALDALIGTCKPHLKGRELPLYSLADIEADYRLLAKQSETNSFSLGKWLPSLGKIRNLMAGELVFLIGDTGTGKTAILQNISFAALPLPTIMFQLELPRELMFERYAAAASRLTCEQIENIYKSSDESMADLLNQKFSNLLVCSESRLTTKKIEEYINYSELKLGQRPKVVLIDYIQLIKGEGSNRREKVSDIAEELKVMAKSTRTIIICSSQISRPQNVTDDWEPNLHSAKESGSIEASCGVLISAWRPIKDPTQFNVKVLKSTKGGAGTLVACNFDGQRMIITERSKIDESDIPKRKQTND